MENIDKAKMDSLLASSFREILQEYRLPWNTELLASKNSGERVPVNVLIVGTSIGLASQMNWGFGPTFNESPQAMMYNSTPDRQHQAISTMYRAGVCLYENVTFSPDAAAALEPKGVPASVDYLAIDYYHGILAVMHQGNIIHNETLTQFSTVNTNQGGG